MRGQVDWVKTNMADVNAAEDGCSCELHSVRTRVELLAASGLETYL